MVIILFFNQKKGKVKHIANYCKVDLIELRD